VSKWGESCAKKKYGYLWAKYSLEEKQDPEKRRTFKAQLEAKLAATESSSEYLQVWFWDESGFSLRVIRRKQWGKRGKRKKLPGKRSRGRVNVMGGLRYHDRHHQCYFIEQGNGDSFYENMLKLNQFVKQEWIGKGNVEIEFEQSEMRIVIV